MTEKFFGRHEQSMAAWWRVGWCSPMVMKSTPAERISSHHLSPLVSPSRSSGGLGLPGLVFDACSSQKSGK